MGIVRFGAPTDLITLLKNEFGLRYFVETGTFKGDTAYWAAEQFERVITIEASESIYDKTKDRFKDVPNVDFRFGESVKVLPNILPLLNQPTIFWLDSHWCFTNSYKGDSECPLLAEIDLLNTLTQEQFLIIDDARLFLSPPPSPHIAEQWPTIDAIIERLKSKSSERYIVIFEDVIIDIPIRARAVLFEFCQKQNAIAQEDRQVLVNQLSQEVARMEAQVNYASDTIIWQKSSIQDYHNTLASVLCSLSWRMTAPLRDGKELLSRTVQSIQRLCRKNEPGTS